MAIIISWLLSLGSKILASKNALIGIGIALAIAISFGAGHHMAAKACHDKALQAQLAAKQAELKKKNEDLAAAIVLNQQLSTQKAKIETVTNTVIKKVPVYMTQCDLNSDLVSNINSVRAQ